VKSTNTTGINIVSDRGDPTHTTGQGLTITMGNFSSNGPGAFEFGVNSDFLYIGKVSTGSYNDGNWHYLVGVFDQPSGTAVTPTSFTLYADGVFYWDLK
jgi:hypothetical protein